MLNTRTWYLENNYQKTFFDKFDRKLENKSNENITAKMEAIKSYFKIQ